MEEKDADNVRKVLCKVFIQCYKGNKGRCKESTIRGHRKKSEPQIYPDIRYRCIVPFFSKQAMLIENWTNELILL